jgi:hypothetical protein
MSGILLFLLLLTAREGALSVDFPAVRSPAPCCGHSGRRGAFVRADDKTGAVFSVKTGAPAVILNRH